MRQTIISALTARLQEQPTIHALWLEGADASGHTDRFSDIDLWADVDAGYEAQMFDTIRAALRKFGPLITDYAATHPHPRISQHFFQIEGVPPFWFVDVCLQHHGRGFNFRPQDPFFPLFDPYGFLEKARAERTAWTEEHKAVTTRAKMLQRGRWRSVLVAKELARSHPLEATSYYWDEVLWPLVELLRLRYCPEKQEYGLKHIYRDLPPEAVKELEQLYAVVRPEDLPTACERAAALFDRHLSAILNVRGEQL